MSPIFASFLLGGLLLAALPGLAATNTLDVATYVEKYRAYDARRNEGRGYSDSADSGQLGWGESRVLADYVALYRVTKDPFWLRKLVDHFDRMLASRTDGNGDGYPAWSTDTYSVAHVRIEETASETARLVPRERRILNIERAHAVTGHAYEVTFLSDGRYRVVDFDEGAELGTASANPIDLIPGVTLTIEGEPKAGDRFRVGTTAVAPLEYLIHEGMVLYPVAEFVEIVSSDDALDEGLRDAAERYLDAIRTEFVPKWEPYWVDVDAERGAYRATDSPAERYPGRILPHNQYAMTAQTYFVLQAVRDLPTLREKAVKMARYFKSYLRVVDGAYEWNYWDWGDGEDEHSGPEDSSHAAINVGLAVEAYRRGLVFDRADLERFTRTLLDRMWNGSLSEPVVGDRIDSKKGDRYFPIRRWIELAEIDPTVWEVCLALFRKRGEPVELIPTMLFAQEVVLKRAATR